MHATLTEILENHKSGLLWVTQEGLVRYANGDACARTGLAAGGRLYDPDLTRAVAAAVLGRTSGVVTATGRPLQQGAVVPELKCRVVPGLARDDAFVFIRDESATDEGTAFRNLMQVIDSDLAKPLRSANETLALAEEGDGHSREPLLAQLRELLQVLDKLLDLAGIWTSGALLATDRIELWPLLQQVWAELQSLALARSVKVRFKAQDEIANLATLYGSETWLRRVFLECLEAAIRAARPSSTLVIEHRQMGPRALIVFRDSGVFSSLGGDGVELTAPGAPGSRSAPRSNPGARESIGLHLCRHIVSLHGGQLREEQEGDERNFLIDLPTGAPHRTATPQIDIAQAQRYATDLAALMARARSRKT